MNIKPLIGIVVVAGIGAIGLSEEVEAQTSSSWACGFLMSCEPSAALADPVFTDPDWHSFADPCGFLMSCEPPAAFADPVFAGPDWDPFADPCGFLMSCEPPAAFADPVFAGPDWDPFADPCGFLMSCEPPAAFADPVFAGPDWDPFADPCGFLMSCEPPAALPDPDWDSFADPLVSVMRQGLPVPSSEQSTTMSAAIPDAKQPCGFIMACPQEATAIQPREARDPWHVTDPSCRLNMSCNKPFDASLTITEWPATLRPFRPFGHISLVVTIINDLGLPESLEFGYAPQSFPYVSSEGHIRLEEAPLGARAITIPVHRDKVMAYLASFGAPGLGGTGTVDKTYTLWGSNCVRFVDDFITAGIGVPSNYISDWNILKNHPRWYMERLLVMDEWPSGHTQCTIR